jgi:hypothetical protein
LIQEVSEDDAIAHFRFRKRHLQEMANKLWPCVREYVVEVKASIRFDSGNYSAPYESSTSGFVPIFTAEASEARDGVLLSFQEVKNLGWHQRNGKCAVFGCQCLPTKATNISSQNGVLC